MNAAPDHHGPPATLPAKSAVAGRSAVGLVRHSFDTEQAALRLFSPERRWGGTFARLFRLDDESDGARFLLNLRIACLLHDLGKANEEFVRAVQGPGREAQSLRHEHLSALLLAVPAVRAWLARNPAVDADVVTAAVLSHHLKAHPQHAEWRWCRPRGRPLVRLYFDHAEVLEVLRRVAHLAGLGPPPAVPADPWSARGPWADAWQLGMANAKRFGRDLRGDPARRNLLLACKAGVIAADSVASALVRTGDSIDEWIDRVAGAPPLSEGDVESAIIEPRVEFLRGRRGAFSFHTFQLEAAAVGPRALLLAGCGAGKTLAAWKWAAARAAEREIGRVVFLYPTRGTATEGFRDYVGWAPEGMAALVHGTSGYELEAMARNPSEAVRGKDHALGDEDRRLFALGLWSRRFFSATVDRFLAFLDHDYESFCLLPALADAAVVLDEVHSYDEHMFANLVAFLRAFDVPVLCMTATLPEGRRAQLADAGLTIFPGPADRERLHDLEASERQPRYRVRTVDHVDAALARAVEARRAGLRVLWVVNTVARCQTLADRLRAVAPDVLCYHSRFKLADRQQRHAAVVAAFQDDAPAIAVTTQVCEMSLDLDADVLVTELAPPSSLVQRLGRANRHLARGRDFRAEVLVYRPETLAPYDRAELDAAARMVAELGTGDADQRRLAELLAVHCRAEPLADGSARFLEGGYFAVPGAFRDGREHTAPAVLDADLDAVRGLVHERRPIDGFLVDVPHRDRLESDVPWLPRHVGVVPAERYDAFLGFDSRRGEAT